MSGLLTKLLQAPVKFPLVRGMLSYAIIWPTCSIVQEYLEHGTSLAKANWARAARFSFFGTFFMAPVFYGWMKYSSRFFKRKDLMTAISRAAVEQVTYSPLAMAYFFFGMSMLEGKSYKVCANEVREKFWPTYKIGAVFWPTAQTLNFYLVSEKNRIVFVSFASFLWTVYLAHMKGKQQNSSTDLSFLNIEPITTNLDPEDKNIESDIDKAKRAVGEISPDLGPQMDIKTDFEDVNENSGVVVERSPKFLSDIRAEGENAHVKVETLIESEEDDDEEELNSDMKTAEDFDEQLGLVSHS